MPSGHPKPRAAVFFWGGVDWVTLGRLHWKSQLKGEFQWSQPWNQIRVFFFLTFGDVSHGKRFVCFFLSLWAVWVRDIMASPARHKALQRPISSINKALLNGVRGGVRWPATNISGTMLPNTQPAQALVRQVSLGSAVQPWWKQWEKTHWINWITNFIDGPNN